MESTITKLLDPDLECSKSKIKNDMIVLHVYSAKQKLMCPYYGSFSSRVHSIYQREIQDIPLHEKQTILLLDTRKMYCDNPECTHKTFAERFDFVAPNGKKTKRLVEKILITSAKLSSVNASALLKSDSVKASKSSICDLLKKMPALVDKSAVTKVCVDDFAFRKRYTYGSVMVDLETHSIIYIIESRETKKVEEWLKSYANLKIISRDGAQTYSSASTNSHSDALQISDKFHLLKNLSDAVQKYMHHLFPSRLVIPATSQNAEMQALYGTRNRAERICFAHEKRQEGYAINDIALLLYSAATTVQKYLAIPEAEILKVKENARERQHIRQKQIKQAAMEEVRTLYEQGNAVDEISRLTGHSILTYLKKDCPTNNGHYDCRHPGKLAPYEQTVIEMRAKGITYNKIHEYICNKGYSGTVASLRVFMQKERTHVKSVSKNENGPVEYISRKCFCQLIFQELEKVNGLTSEQYEDAIKKYPIYNKNIFLAQRFSPYCIFTSKQRTRFMDYESGTITY